MDRYCTILDLQDRLAASTMVLHPTGWYCTILDLQDRLAASTMVLHPTGWYCTILSLQDLAELKPGSPSA